MDWTEDEKELLRINAVEAIEDDIYQYISEVIHRNGGDFSAAYGYWQHKEVIGEIFEGLFMALPDDFGIL